MITKILAATGLPFRETMFDREPTKTYAVFFDEVTADGPDDGNRIFTHDITVELYEPEPDVKAEAALEAELNERGLHWVRQSRYWLHDVQRYQVIYEFSYITKT